MHKDYQKFIEAIHKKKLVKIVLDTEEKGIINRKCVPFDFAISKKYNDGKERFHFFDLDSPDGQHNLSILPENLKSLEILEELFNPADYVKWTPNWAISRDWSIYS